MEYGYQVLGQTGFGYDVSADGQPEVKVGGITIDWSTVVAVGSDTTLVDFVIVKSGQKYLRGGQVMARITNAGAFTITVTGTPTGGSFTITATNPLNGLTTTQTVAFNASVANVQTALDALFGAGNTVVTGAGALPGNVQTVTQAGLLLGWPIATPTVNGALLTGGVAPAVAVAVTQAGQSTGKYGPWDPNATDGRAVLSRGSIGLLRTHILQNGPTGLFTTMPTDHAGLVTGGLLWKAKVLQSGVAAHSLAAGPTLAEFEAAFPRVRWAIQ